METKSRIQVINEQLQIRDIFFESVGKILEMCDIKDNILCPGQKGFVLEAKKGYWGPKRDASGNAIEYDSLDKAMKAYDNCSQGLRVRKTDNGYRYSIGNIVENIMQLDKTEGSVDLEAGIVMMNPYSGAEEHKE